MTTEVRGIVARSAKEPVEMLTVLVPDPGPGEAVVGVEACGVCHTDLHYREGGISDDFPFLLGHEAAGTVEAVGTGVMSVAPGDFVVLNWRAVCGAVPLLPARQALVCFSTFNATQKMTLADGTELSPALGIGAFAEKTLVADGQCTPVDPPARPEAAGLLGLRSDGRPRRGHATPAGSDAAIRWRSSAAEASVARRSRALSWRARTRSSPSTSMPGSSRWRKRFRRHATVDASKEDAVEAVRALTGGNGADVVHRGGREPEGHGAGVLRPGPGRNTRTGRRTHARHAHRPPDDRVLRSGRALKPSWYGDCLPSRDFPMLIDLYLQGRLDLDKFVSETIRLDGVEDAFARMQRGEVLRSVVSLKA